LGRTSLPMPLSREIRSSGPFRNGSPFRSPFTGFARLSESFSGPRSGTWVHRSLLAVFTATRSSADRPARTRRSSPLPQTWAPSQGHRPDVGSVPAGTGHPLLRFLAPSTVIPTGVRSSRVCLSRHVPPSGFLTPSTGFSPPRPAATRTAAVPGVSFGPLTVHGIPVADVAPRRPAPGLVKLLIP
jgi:hypothetical protein